MALAFGLLHGLGVAGALIDAGLPGEDVAFALLAFNVGVEVGQLMFIGVVLLVALLIWRMQIPASSWRRGRTALAYGIGTLSATWFIGRVVAF